MDKLTGIREEVARIVEGAIADAINMDWPDARDIGVDRLLALFSSQDSGSPPDHATAAGSVASGQPAIPEGLAALVLQLGEVEWAATAALSSADHAEIFKQSVELTAEAFGQNGPQELSGLYLAGTGTVLCYTGTSPNSPTIARALTGAWNHLLSQCRANSSAKPAVDDSSQDTLKPSSNDTGGDGGE